MAKVLQSLLAGIFLALFFGPVQALTLTEAQKLLPNEWSRTNLFGTSLTIEDDTALIGAPGGVFLMGAAYVFTRTSGGTWTEQAKLTPSDAGPYQSFGWSVALMGDTALVGAPGAAAGGVPHAGALYVFTRDGSGDWTERTKLTAADAAPSRLFGWSVALAGDTAVVGSPSHSFSTSYPGAAYIFARDGSGNWSEQAKLTASDAMAADDFGVSVTVAGDSAVVGAAGADVGGTNTGAAYVFARDSSGIWNQRAKLTAADAAAGDLLGSSVALAGSTALLGAVGKRTDNVFGAGAAYVFVRTSGGRWKEQTKLTITDTAINDELGASVALAGSTALVGAPGKYKGTGGAYVFTRGGGNWTEQAKLTANVPVAITFFGNSVALADDTALVGAPADSEAGAGAPRGTAYVFSLASLDNAPPTADAGPDQTLTCASRSGTKVSLDGSGSADPDGDTLSYRWTWDEHTASRETPIVRLPLGTTTVDLTVSDGKLEDSDPVDITVLTRVLGLGKPLSNLSPAGAQPPLPGSAFKAGRTLPLKLGLSCRGGAALTGADVSAPYISSLYPRGASSPVPLDQRLDSGSANANGPNFRSAGKTWVYNLSTKGLSPGTYTIIIGMPDGRLFSGGFMLR